MRLGGPIFGDWKGDLDRWAKLVRDHGYGAAVCPLKPGVDDAEIRACREAAARADVVIAEVGAWRNNPISPNDAERKRSIQNTIAALDLAERVGARVCVNIAGSRDPGQWDGPHPENVSEETFALIVDSVREIVDAVKPTRTTYALEAMPYTLPDSPEAYLKLLAAIDRPTMTAVHLDPVNMIHTPRLAYDTAGFLRRCFRLLGPYVRTVHAKDTKLQHKLTVHLDEAVPGEGSLDYRVFLRELDAIDPDIPILVEHLSNAETYRRAADYIRGVAKAEGIALR